ncbi:MAG: uracil-DNA glycosylase [Candidatus Thiodiazotropha sp.]
MSFDSNCRQCPRLSSFLKQVRQQYPHYHTAPVAPFGDPEARLLIVGLAPGMHGANATGRPFTGDFAGILLYETLHANGFSNQAEATSPDDGLELYDCRITNAVKCLPPQNKPIGSEINSCNRHLSAELAGLPAPSVIIALGTIAHRSVVKGFKLRQAACPFGHGAEHELPQGHRLLDSYHCSRYNTQTRRLTPTMFNRVFRRARVLLDAV